MKKAFVILTILLLAVMVVPSAMALLRVNGVEVGTGGGGGGGGTNDQTLAEVLMEGNTAAGQEAVDFSAIGIGVADATNALDVKGNILVFSDDSAFVSLERATTNDFNGFKLRTTGSSDWTIGTRPTDFDLHFYEEGLAATLMIIELSGNVGIGTNDPDTKLHIKDGNAKVEGVVPILQLESTDTDALGTAEILNFKGCLKIKNGVGDELIQLHGGPFFGNTNIIFQPSSAGNVGIAVAAADATERLTVNGNIMPHVSNSFTLGTSAKPWSDIHLGSTIHHDSNLYVVDGGGTTNLTIGTDGTVTANFAGDGSGLTNLPGGAETDPVWAAASNLYARLAEANTFAASQTIQGNTIVTGGNINVHGAVPLVSLKNYGAVTQTVEILNFEGCLKLKNGEGDELIQLHSAAFFGTDDLILQPNAAGRVVIGAPTNKQGVLHLAGGNDQFVIEDTDRAIANENIWWQKADGGGFEMLAISDAGGGFVRVFQINRTGTTPDDMRLNADFLPNTSNTYDLGTSALPWNDLYLSSKIDFSSDLELVSAAGNTGLVIQMDGDLLAGGDIIPSVSNSFALGSADFPWSTVHVSAATILLGGVPLSTENGVLTVNSTNVGDVATGASNAFTEANSFEGDLAVVGADLSVILVAGGPSEVINETFTTDPYLGDWQTEIGTGTYWASGSGQLVKQVGSGFSSTDQYSNGTQYASSVYELQYTVVSGEVSGGGGSMNFVVRSNTTTVLNTPAISAGVTGTFKHTFTGVWDNIRIVGGGGGGPGWFVKWFVDNVTVTNTGGTASGGALAANAFTLGSESEIESWGDVTNFLTAESDPSVAAGLPLPAMDASALTNVPETDPSVAVGLALPAMDAGSLTNVPDPVGVPFLADINTYSGTNIFGTAGLPKRDVVLIRAATNDSGHYLGFESAPGSPSGIGRISFEGSPNSLRASTAWGVAGTVFPSTDGTYYIGQPATAWKGIHLTDEITYDADLVFRGPNGNTNLTLGTNGVLTGDGGGLTNLPAGAEVDPTVAAGLALPAMDAGALTNVPAPSGVALLASNNTFTKTNVFGVAGGPRDHSLIIRANNSGQGNWIGFEASPFSGVAASIALETNYFRFTDEVRTEGDIIPWGSNTLDLGSATLPWAEIHLGSTIFYDSDLEFRGPDGNTNLAISTAGVISGDGSGLTGVTETDPTVAAGLALPAMDGSAVTNLTELDPGLAAGETLPAMDGGALTNLTELDPGLAAGETLPAMDGGALTNLTETDPSVAAGLSLPAMDAGALTNVTASPPANVAYTTNANAWSVGQTFKELTVDAVGSGEGNWLKFNSSVGNPGLKLKYTTLGGAFGGSLMFDRDIGGTNVNAFFASNGIPNALGTPTSPWDTVYGNLFVGNGAGLTNLPPGAETDPVYTNDLANGLHIGGASSVDGDLVVTGAVTVSGDILPSASNAYALGSADFPWSELHVEGSTIFLGGKALKNDTGDLTWVTPSVVDSDDFTDDFTAPMTNAGSGWNITGTWGGFFAGDIGHETINDGNAILVTRAGEMELNQGFTNQDVTVSFFARGSHAGPSGDSHEGIIVDDGGTTQLVYSAPHGASVTVGTNINTTFNNFSGKLIWSTTDASTSGGVYVSNLVVSWSSVLTPGSTSTTVTAESGVISDPKVDRLYFDDLGNATNVAFLYFSNGVPRKAVNGTHSDL